LCAQFLGHEILCAQKCDHLSNNRIYKDYNCAHKIKINKILCAQIKKKRKPNNNIYIKKKI